MARFATPDLVVVKVGSNSLRAPDGGLDESVIVDLVAQLAKLVGAGIRVVLVSSGAVAAGLAPLQMRTRPPDLPGLQAAASVGQGLLLHRYQAAFATHGMACGQVLLMAGDMVDRRRYLNARNTFERLLDLGAVPVVNENDTVATEELRVGDNDRLAALVAGMLGADLLVLLSDVEGLYGDDPARDPDALPLDTVEDPSIVDRTRVGGSASAVGTGGMVTKLDAARIATLGAADVVIAHAHRPGVLAEVVSGAPVGTWFPAKDRPESRKLWIAFATAPRGSLLIDAGAVRALVERGSSLLAVGITDVHGGFAAGSAVNIVGPDQQLVARGLVAFDAAAVREMLGRATRELHPAHRRAVVHRDSLVVLV
ncbi:MAG: glutamate 5-kinase [Actinobacteria bacterium]|nr:glutamate 5-kinase [Actinomycetota bacterium]